MSEFDKPLTLTTPLITGQKVKDAQWLLLGHNVFSTTSKHLSTYTGRLDGEYGPVAAGATKEAKYELGYPDAACDGVFGQRLYDYLTGQEELPQAYKTIRTARSQTSYKATALYYATQNIGIKEQPFGSNHQKYGKWYGMDGVPWCAIFVSWCINSALGTLDKPTWKYSYVPTIASDAAQGLGRMSITYNPQPGDLVTYNFSGPNCHVEFYEKMLSENSFSAVGGNTGPANYSNGGEVARSIRYNPNVTHFIRLTL